MTPAELEEQKRAFMLAPKRLFGPEGFSRVAYETFPEIMGGESARRDLRWAVEVNGHRRVKWAAPSRNIIGESVLTTIVFRFEIVKFANGARDPYFHPEQFIACFDTEDDEARFKAALQALEQGDGRDKWRKILRPERW